ncbi:hypothetical protein GCM10025866_14860 [Naasia aerilata]|uniref:Uncharacterized protein n=1 Tax=Naasia aerilata TaxID=1162966 RepID=A0ABM8GBI4_9MICO|nr:hypothetical protein GCM10025866_14860 [Naasia aerilata]
MPEGTEARGFVLYVGVDEAKALDAGTDLSTLVEALRRLTVDLVPGAQTHAAVALAPAERAGGTSTSCASPSRTRRPWPVTAPWTSRRRTPWRA